MKQRRSFFQLHCIKSQRNSSPRRRLSETGTFTHDHTCPVQAKSSLTLDLVAGKAGLWLSDRISFPNSLLTFELKTSAMPISTLVCELSGISGFYEQRRKDPGGLKGEINLEMMSTLTFQAVRKKDGIWKQAQLWGKFADMSERDTYLERRCFIIMGTDRNRSTRQVLLFWLVPTRAQTQELNHQHSSSRSHFHPIYFWMEPGVRHLQKCSPRFPV